MIGFAGIARPQGIRVEVFDAATAVRELSRTARVLTGRDEAFFALPNETDTHEPLTLDGQRRIVADARVDARSELVAKLDAGASLCATADAELILRSYLKWGEQCVEHLLGDFSFVTWNNDGELFAARDHFGVRPFFYAEVGGSLYFSNVLQMLRYHPAVPKDLNDLAIADFLMFGANQDVSSTAFAHIRRLPPAHTLQWSKGRATLRHYWRLPTDGAIRYRRTQHYLDHFRELMTHAVADRLRTRKAAILMSGGLDSTAIAAVARQVRPTCPVELRAFTAVYDSIIPDEERHFSGVAAKALGIDIEYSRFDDCRPFLGWDTPDRIAPEPASDIFSAAAQEQICRAAAYSRVLLTGFGGDPVMHVSPHYALSLLKRLHWARLAAGTLAYCRIRHKLPNIGLRRFIRQKLRLEQRHRQPFPEWLNPEFERSLHLKQRFEEITAERGPLHPVRPEPYDQLLSPIWPSIFEEFHPYRTGLPLECAHPFFDLRLVTFLLAIPPIPWCVDKEFLRSIEAGSLPAEIRLRPKTPLRGDPLAEFIARQQNEDIIRFVPVPRINQYVNVEKISRPLRDECAYDVMLRLLPKCLNYWLRDSTT